MVFMTRVLITGATSGLGLELAKGFQAQGANLFLVGRRPLAELPPKLFDEHTYCQVDLAEAEAMNKVMAFLEARGVTTLDVVIHSAGLGYYGDLKQQSAASIKELLSVNLHAPLALSQALLGHLKASHGRLVFISSIAANLPTPDYAVYSASKAALDGLARNIASECHDCIRVQVIHPGATRTDMHRKSGVPEGHFNMGRFAPPAEVAGEIIQAISEDRFDVTIGRTNRIIRFFGRYFGNVIETVMRRRRRARARKQPPAEPISPASVGDDVSELTSEALAVDSAPVPGSPPLAPKSTQAEGVPQADVTSQAGDISSTSQPKHQKPEHQKSEHQKPEHQERLVLKTPEQETPVQPTAEQEIPAQPTSTKEASS
jgi:short-subunit dehydrogenase